MSDDKTNTENDLTPAEKKVVNGARVFMGIVRLVIDIAFFIVFTYMAFLILKGDFDYNTVALCSVSFFYLLADATGQGFRRAYAILSASATRPGDTG